ncbi:MAG TPA: hypothetical protein VGD00_08110 [Solirubrobacteraceae bacterium]|jgi:ketosteroid isomerase-like protein
MADTDTIGASFARALAEKDADALRGLLHPQIEFRALTPKRAWEADDPGQVLDIVFGKWFEDSDQIEALEAVETDTVADRERLLYRVRVSNPEGDFVVEQQGYLTEQDGKIGWMRLVCSGYRPVE